MARIYGCDWTHWQGPEVIPAQQIEDEGFKYVWLKSSGSIKEGPFFMDPVFHQNAHAIAEHTSMTRGAYHYLMPRYGRTQAALLLDQMLRVSGQDSLAGSGWLAKLDVEQVGVTRKDVVDFCTAWSDLTGDYPLWIYTNRYFWISNNLGNGISLAPLLENSKWVAEEIRTDTTKPYASQHYRGVSDLGYWTVYYGGWTKANMLQFTNRALIAGKYIPASAYPNTQDNLKMVGTR